MSVFGNAVIFCNLPTLLKFMLNMCTTAALF